MSFRVLLTGLVAGVGLSLARAPEGLSLFGTPAVLAGDAMLFRGGMLVAIGIAWWLARWHDEAPRAAWALWGAVLGYAGHGLFLAEQLRLVSYATGALAALAVIGLTFAILRARREEYESEPPRPSALHLGGLALLGAGVSLAFESLARPLRLLGGASENETMFGCTLLLTLAIGAAAFGPLLGGLRKFPWTPLLGTAAAALAMYGVSFLGQASDPDGYDVFVSYFRWNLKLNSFWELEQGTLVHDAAIGLRTFVLAGFALGAALHTLRHRTQLAAISIGAGLALLAMPQLVEWTARGAQDRLAELPAQRVVIATSIAALGAVLALIGHDAQTRVARAAAAVGAVGFAGFLWARDNPGALPLSPWEVWRVRPAIVAEVPEGIVTIELRRRMGEVVTLNRRIVSPGDANFRSDDASITASVGTWGGTRPIEGKVLLVGQLTPDRARILTSLGATAVDRTGPWHVCMSDLESALFGGEADTPGSILTPSQAAGRLHEYRLILCPAAWPQDLATTAAWRSPAPGGGRKVLWFRADQPHSALDWGERVLLAGHNFKHTLIGVTNGGELENGWSSIPELVPVGPGASAGSAWQRLTTRVFERSMGDLARSGARIRAGTQGTAFESLGNALANLTSAQARSEFWEEDVQSTELDPAGLASLRDAAVQQLGQGALQPFVRSTVEYVASLLVGKREVEWIYEYIDPIRDASQGWLALERTLAHADWEMLEFEAVADRLGSMMEAAPYDLELLQWHGLALLHAGRPEEAVQSLRKLVETAPGQRAFERQLAIALVRAGDDTGRDLIEELLRQDPDDEALELYLAPGPLPELEPPPPFGDVGLERTADH